MNPVAPTAAEVDEILELACRAPSVHNTQPWSWRVTGGQVDLFADFRRQLVYADPGRRDLMLSCGAALHHLQVAAAGLGWATRVRRLPAADDERHVASVLLRRARGSSDSADLLRAVVERRTDRRRLSSWPVPAERLNSLSSTGSVWGAQVLPVSGELARARLHRLTQRADEVQRRNQRYVAELAAWTGTLARRGRARLARALPGGRGDRGPGQPSLPGRRAGRPRGRPRPGAGRDAAGVHLLGRSDLPGPRRGGAQRGAGCTPPATTSRCCR